MLKYVETKVGFSEVPDEITLCINISNCPNKCKGCHSPHLQEDIGEELNPVVLSDLIVHNPGITCVAFMGGDSDPLGIHILAEWVKNNTELKTCWYRGRELHYLNHLHDYLDFVKTGPYIKEVGGLNVPTTNQRFYKVNHTVKEGFPYNTFDDITHKFLTL